MPGDQWSLSSIDPKSGSASAFEASVGTGLSGPTGPAGWLADVFKAVPSKNDLLVQAPFFWTDMVATADVKIGNWQKATKGYAKVTDRSALWRPVQEWEDQAAAASAMGSDNKTAIGSESPPKGGVKGRRAVVVFAKCSLCTLLSADRSYIRGPYVLLGTYNDNWGMLSDGRVGQVRVPRVLILPP